MKYKVVSEMSITTSQKNDVKKDLSYENAKKFMAASVLALTEKYSDSEVNQVSDDQITVKLRGTTICLTITEMDKDYES